MRSWIAAVGAAVLAHAAPARAGGLTEQDVAAAMQEPAVRGALEQCVGEAMRPATIELVIVVDEGGRASLASTRPVVERSVGSCLAGALGKASFPATGGRYQVVYPLELAEGGEAAVPASEWEPLYRSGQAMFVSGIVITASGAVVAGVSAFFILLTWFMGDATATWPTSGWVILGGAGGIALGVPLLVVGIVKKRRASRIKAGLALEVTGGAIPTLRLRF